MPSVIVAWLACAGAAIVIAATLIDAFEVMLLPRRVQRRLRFVRVYFRGTWYAWSRLSGVRPMSRVHGTFLSVYGPLSMLGLFVVWMASIVVGFGFLQWSMAALLSPADVPTLTDELYFSGTTFFTLGYGDLTAHTEIGHFFSVVESGIGLGLIAIVIGYLPVLYQTFSRREAHVIRLDARAGSPPTAAELLARHAVSAQGLASLGALLLEWEVWAAELLESHLAYPMLAYYRSQHDNESWLAAVTTILDSCALLSLGLCREQPGDDAADDALPTFQARMTFATARLAVIEMARALHSAPRLAGQDTDSREAEHHATEQLYQAAALPIAPTLARDHAERLPPIALDRLAARLAEVDLGFGDDVSLAHARLATLRGTYEPFLEALAERLLLPLPRWVAYDDATDNWQQSVGGADARRLLDDAQLAEDAR